MSDTPDASAPAPASTGTEREFPCEQCGAELVFEPGAMALKCGYCGHVNEIPQLPEAMVAEEDFEQTLERLAAEEDVVTVATVRCTGCGAETTREPGIASGLCPFCGTPIVSAAGSTRVIKPNCVLPFHIKRDEADAKFDAWLHSLWFAPSALRRMGRNHQLAGMYVPYWTYDCGTHSQYTGQRGDDYWVTESYTRTVNGKTEHATRRVKKTRWRWVSGAVTNDFDDVLVLASTSLPQKCAEALEPWDLGEAKPFQEEYLSGFRAESYHVDLPAGFVRAKEIMDPTIRQTVNRDIGGDHQRINSLSTQYHDITFKHLLLPMWISAYRYMDKAFRFLVNARTGEVQGERPWSVWKIVLTVVAVLAVIGTIAGLVAMNQ